MSLMYEQAERNSRLTLVNSLFAETMNDWSERIQKLTTDQAAAASAGDIARTCRLDLVLWCSQN